MAKQLHATETLDYLVYMTIDETIKQIFKDPGTRVIYDFFEDNNHLKQREIAEKPEAFSDGLERLIGPAAQVIEKAILKNLYRKVDLKFEDKPGYRFSDYVKELRKRLKR